MFQALTPQQILSDEEAAYIIEKYGLKSVFFGEHLGEEFDLDQDIEAFTSELNETICLNKVFDHKSNTHIWFMN